MAEPGARTGNDQLTGRIRELEARVSRLEQRLETGAAPRLETASRPPASPETAAWVETLSAIPVLGVSMLGLAGAYILRALTEARAVPQAIGVFAAMLYAALWLAWAARIPASRRAEAVLYSLTSALVVGPLLWESTLRFHAISTWTAATVLLVFTIFGLVISWRKNLLIVATIATMTGAVTAVALLIGSHDVAPFLFLLLAIAAAVEVSACLDHWLTERWLTAAAADLAVLLATYLVTGIGGLPASYVPFSRATVLASQIALPGIYLSSILVRTLLRGSTFTVFETGQLAIAFFLAVGGGLRLSGDPRIAPALAAVCLGCGACCYAAGFFGKQRNLRVYTTFGFALAVIGTRVGLLDAALAIAWSVLAVIAMRPAQPWFRWHACGYLLLSLAASGALAYSTRLLLGSTDVHGTLLPLLSGAAIALICYAFTVRAQLGYPAIQPIFAGIALWLLAGITAAALPAFYHALFGAQAPHAFCGTLRTMVLAAAAVLLAWIGSRRRGLAFTPLIYLVLIPGAYRLLLIDLRQDNKAALVLSLLLYGGALLLLPRFLAPRQTAAR
jgi:hypothetical protein